MSWTALGGWLVALIALAAFARALKRRDSRWTNADEARALASRLLVGFEGHAVLLGTDGRAAVIAGNGALAVLRWRNGRTEACRLVSPLRVREAIEGATIDSGPPEFFRATLTGVLISEVRQLEASILHQAVP